MKTIISILTIMLLFFSTPLWAVDLQNASLKELVNQRPDLVQAVKSGKDEGSSTVSVVKDKGRMSVWTQERRDINDNLIDKRKDSYTYYLTDEVDTITMERYDSNDKLASKKVLKHYRDGTQPDLSVVAVEIPKGL